MAKKFEDMSPDEQKVEWKRRIGLRNARVKLGFDRSMAVLKALERHNPCTLTSEQIGEIVGVGGHQVNSHLKKLREAGMIKSEVKRFRVPGVPHVMCIRTIRVTNE